MSALGTMKRAAKIHINQHGFTMIEVVTFDFVLEFWYHLETGRKDGHYEII